MNRSSRIFFFCLMVGVVVVVSCHSSQTEVTEEVYIHSQPDTFSYSLKDDKADCRYEASPSSGEEVQTVPLYTYNCGLAVGDETVAVVWGNKELGSAYYLYMSREYYQRHTDKLQEAIERNR